MSMGNEELATADFFRLLASTKTPLPILKQLALLLQRQGLIDKSVDSLRDCLKNDMDEKWCKVEFKSMKKIQKILIKINAFYEASQWMSFVGVSVVEGFLDSLVGKGVDVVIKDIMSRTCYSYGNVN